MTLTPKWTLLTSRHPPGSDVKRSSSRMPPSQVASHDLYLGLVVCFPRFPCPTTSAPVLRQSDSSPGMPAFSLGVRQLLDTFNSAPAESPTAAARRLAAVLTDFTGVPGAVLVRGTGAIRRRSSHLKFSATIRHPWPPDAAAVGAGKSRSHLTRRPVTDQPFRQLVTFRGPRLVRRHRYRPDDHLRRYQRPVRRATPEATLQIRPVSAGQQVT
jgi:hypothetical protein